MNRQSGIALVTSLFILVAVMLVGLGSIFLTQTNLRVAENIRSNALARNNANTGLEAAYLILESYHTSYNTFPTSSSDFSLPAGGGFALVSYRFDHADQVMVRVRGSTSRGAEHEVEGLFSLYQAPPEIPESYTIGLVSEGEVEVNSNASIYTDSGVHGNSGFDLAGDFYECTARDASGTCIASVLVTVDPPVTLASLTGTCKIGNQTCSPIDYLTDPVSVAPNYHVRRDAAMDLDNNGVVDVNDCLGALTVPVPAMSNVVVCTTGNVTLNNAVLSDVTIITDGDITLTGTATLTNTTLISTGGLVDIESGTFTDTRIFSEDSLTFAGSGNAYTWNDSNTIATAGDITFNGQNDHNNTINPITNPDGTKGIGLALIADGDITQNGSNSSNADYYALIVSGGNFVQNGKSTLFGAVSAVGDLRFNGKFFIDSGYSFSNPDLEEMPEPEVEVLSRR